MTIDTIFERYGVPEEVQDAALVRGAYVQDLARAWVGGAVSWPLLTKALIFASLGETSAHIRKKVGLDKYLVTLIARGTPTYLETVARTHDVHQLIYAYALWRTEPDGAVTRSLVWNTVRERVERNLLHSVDPPPTLSPKRAHALRAIDILHYKNPSV
jgi:hypothetical protein